MRRPPPYRVVACVAFALACPRKAYALDLPEDGDKVLPCRPTIACTAEIVPAGTTEIEAGVLRKRAATGALTWTTPVLLKATLTDWGQLQVGTNGFTHAREPLDDHANYLDNVSVGGKFAILHQGTYAPAISASAALSFPTFERPYYDRNDDATFLAYVTKDIGRLHADLNVGVNVERFEDARVAPYAALALSTALPKDFGVMAEGYVFASAAPVADKDGGFLFAVNYAAATWAVFDAGFDVGLFRDERDYNLFAGVTFVPVMLWRSPPTPARP